MTKKTNNFKNYFVYQYHFLDDLSSILDPFLYFRPMMKKKEITKDIKDIKDLFSENGWEGDGEIGLICFPPFVDIGYENTWGTYIWHVKQNNNGTSFLASEYPLGFKRLLQQNEIVNPQKDYIPVNIIYTKVKWFTDKINRYKQELTNIIDYLSINDLGGIEKSILNNVTDNIQGLLIRILNEFLDECYLEFLIEVIDNGNQSKIKILPYKVHLSPNQYIPDDSGIFERYTEADGKWFTLKGIISDMRNAYRFEPFKNKIEMLFKSVGFVWENTKISQIIKHVILRNCMQHHEGVLTKDALKQLGLNRVTLLDNKGKYEIKAWEKIWFGDTELYKLCELLEEFALGFNSYVERRIHIRQYVKKK